MTHKGSCDRGRIAFEVDGGLAHCSHCSSKHEKKGARRKVEQVNAAQRLDDLRIPPGNRLEALKGDRRGQHSIRITDRWRVCFVWKDGAAYDVEIVDYH